MSEVFICGYGAVSPTGWGVKAMLEALEQQTPVPARPIVRPGAVRPLVGLAVPQAQTRPPFFAHARLRRTSPIAQYAVGAALEALGDDIHNGEMRIGIIYCSMVGCVIYSRRFYAEVLKEPATASPLVFPETVLNSPASHLAALLGTRAVNYTLIGDQGTYLQGLALAASWLADQRVESCLVIGAEELDWLIIEAIGVLDRKSVASEGAGALYLKTKADASAQPIRLTAISHAHLFSNRARRLEAAQRARAELAGDQPDALLCLGVQGCSKLDHDEEEAWSDWKGAKIAPKVCLGEGMMAAAAWQCVAAAALLRQGRYSMANISVVGANQQAIGARFTAG